MPGPLHVGVLLCPDFQLLDMAPVDLFHMTGKEYLTTCEMPPAMIALGHETVTTSYISTQPDASWAQATASAAVRINYSDLSHPDIAPGKLDILFIPGPEPNFVPNEATRAFIRAHAAQGPAITVITICTGIFMAGYAGILDGKAATGPRLLTGRLEKLFPKAKFEDRRWSIDGNIWSSGGVTNGQDMVAAYLRQTYARPLADMVCVLADVGERGQNYETFKMTDTVWAAWCVIRSFFTTGGKEKQKKK